MPLMKLYIDRTQPEAVKAALGDGLDELRSLVCEQLDVPVAAAHLALIEHVGLPDQPQINVEVKYLGREDRTRDKIEAVCKVLRARVEETTGVTTAIRMAMIRPVEYVALK